MKKIILYIAASQDNFVADENAGVDWLPYLKNDAELEALGYKNLMSRIFNVI